MACTASQASNSAVFFVGKYFKTRHYACRDARFAAIGSKTCIKTFFAREYATYSAGIVVVFSGKWRLSQELSHCPSPDPWLCVHGHNGKALLHDAVGKEVGLAVCKQVGEMFLQLFPQLRSRMPRSTICSLISFSI